MFVLFNKTSACIYLVDAVSLFIGGILAVIPMMIPWNVFGSYGFFVIPFMFLLPLSEVFTLIAIRLWKGIPFYQGSRDHFSHYLLKAGWTKRGVLLYSVVFLGMNLILSALFLIGCISSDIYIVSEIIILASWMISIFFARN